MDALLLASVNNNDGDDYEKVLKRILSPFFYLVQFVKCWPILLETVSKFRKRNETKTEREIRYFHVAVVQRRQKNVHKSVRAKLLFCSSKANSILVAVTVDVA